MFLAQRRRDRRGAQAQIEGPEFCEVFKFDKGLELIDRNRSFHGPQLQSQTADFERISIQAPACRASGSVQRAPGNAGQRGLFRFAGHAFWPGVPELDTFDTLGFYAHDH